MAVEVTHCGSAVGLEGVDLRGGLRRGRRGTGRVRDQETTHRELHNRHCFLKKKTEDTGFKKLILFPVNLVLKVQFNKRERN